MVAGIGGLVVDYGWLRVLGGGHDGLPAVTADADQPNGLVVARDVLGGQFVWRQAKPGVKPTVHYLGPEDLAWQDLELGYGDWLNAMLGGALIGFYAPLRWPGWEAEVGAMPPLGWGISTWPPPWTTEGKDLAAVSRRAIGLAELVSAHQEMARQLDVGEP